MKKYILTICIPTYNRLMVYDDVMKYLSLEDDRFCIRVQDNCSTNGLWEKLNTIKDERLILRQNKENIGGIPNQLTVLYGNIQSDYSMIFVDKDFVYLDKLGAFLDFLEEKQPNFGYSYLYEIDTPYIKYFSSGADALNSMAYRCDHPTGRFFRSDLITKEMDQQYYTLLDKKFDFVIDIINAHLAINYEAVLYAKPLIWTANKRNIEIGKTLSYNEENVYFSIGMRLKAYEILIKDLVNIASNKDFYNESVKNLFKRFSGLVSISLRHLLQQQSVCEHYNMKTRRISIIEQIRNVFMLYKLHSRFARNNGLISICIGRMIQICVNNIKEKFIPPKQTDFVI